MSDAQAGPSRDEDELESPPEILRELLEEVVDAAGVEADVVVEEGDGLLTGRVEGDDLGVLIGRHGQTVDALQHLAQRIVFRGVHSDTRVIVDAGGYREQRAADLRADADEAADEAVRTSRSVQLQPMPASERRVVHEHLRERGDVETYSEGEEPDRRLVVAPLER